MTRNYSRRKTSKPFVVVREGVIDKMDNIERPPAMLDEVRGGSTVAAPEALQARWGIEPAGLCLAHVQPGSFQHIFDVRGVPVDAYPVSPAKRFDQEDALHGRIGRCEGVVSD